MSSARSSRNALRLTVLSATVALVALPAASAAAADPPGDWWYKGFGVADVHAQGWNGAGVTIAVIDAQINDQLPVFAGAPLTIEDPVCDDPATSTEVTEPTLHGSNVTALLIGNGEGAGAVKGIVPAADVLFFGMGKDFSLCDTGERKPWATALDSAVAAGADIVTISSVNPSPYEPEVDSLARALKAGVIVVAGTPNEVGRTAQYPAAMNGVVSVNAFDAAGNILTGVDDGVPNIQREVTVVAPGAQMSSVNWEQPQIMSGASYATPLVAGILAAAKQKYPNATANQLIQSLIHNTRADDHPLERDAAGGIGYGPASLRHVLAVDPSQYPDVNPLMDKELGKPTAEQISGDGAATQTPEPTASSVPPTEPAQAGDGDADFPLGWILGGGIAVVAVGATVIIAAVRRRRLQHVDGGSA